MDYATLANAIIIAVGGKDNITSVTHCMTRLRLVLKDESHADDGSVKGLDYVQGVVHANGQYQVIIGPEVADVAAAVAEAVGCELGETTVQEDAPDEIDGLKLPSAGGGIFNRFIRIISSCIFPLVGLLIASGMLRGTLTVLTTAGLMQTTDGAYLALSAVGSSVMYYLPILVGFIAGKTFGANPYLTAVIGASMVYPDIVAALTDGAELTFLGIPLILTRYAYQLFPILIAAWFTGIVERFWRARLPRVISLMFVPLLTMVVVAPITFLVIGPLMTWIGNALAGIVSAIIAVSPTIAGAVLGAFFQVLIMLGVARAFSPIMMNNITTFGEDPILAMAGVSLFALAGAGLGYMLRQKDKKDRSEALMLSLTSFLGISEPIIYSMALPRKSPFIASWIGGALGGAIIGFFGCAVQAYGGGIFQGLLMVSADKPMNVVWWAVASAVSAVVSFLVSLVISKDSSAEASDDHASSESGVQA